MQPNNSFAQPSYQYQPQMPAPVQLPASQPSNAKKSKAPTIIISLLVVAIIALATYIIIDKLVLSKGEAGENSTINIYSTTSFSQALSSLDQNSESYQDDLTAILSGRVFSTDENFYEYIKFEGNQYTLSYYRDPTTERSNVIPSTTTGTYSISGSTISLSDGDTFTITNDYLVKTNDKITTNANTVYFDSLQLPDFVRSYSSALLARVNTWRKNYEDAPTVIKSNVINFSCVTASSNLTSADAFDCNTNYELFYRANKIKTYIVTNKINGSTENDIKATFEDVVKYEKSPYAYLAKNVLYYRDSSFVANANFLVRIVDGAYTIRGDY